MLKLISFLILAQIQYEIPIKEDLILTDPSNEIVLVDTSDTVTIDTDYYKKIILEVKKPSTITIEIKQDQDQDQGWTQFPLHPNAQVVYVDLEGSDLADGLSPETAVKSLHIGMSKLRDGHGDHLLLERGDVWQGQFFPGRHLTGHSSEYPVVIGAYGEGLRPRVEPGNAKGFVLAGQYIALTSIHFKGPDDYTVPRQSMVTSTGPLSDALIEDLLIEDGAFGISLATFTHQATGEVQLVEDIKIRRNLIIDGVNYRNGRLGYASGIFLNGVIGAVIEENYVLDYNYLPGFALETGSHGMYIQYTCQEIIVRRNVVKNSSNNGIMMRPGGIVEDNFLMQQINGIVMGTGKTTELAGGVIRGNTVIDATPSNPERGYTWFADLHALDGVIVEDNIGANFPLTVSNSRALNLGQEFYNVTIRNNRFYHVGWGIHSTIKEGANSIVENNTFYIPEGYGYHRGNILFIGENEVHKSEAPLPIVLPVDLDNRIRAQRKGQWDKQIMAQALIEAVKSAIGDVQ